MKKVAFIILFITLFKMDLNAQHKWTLDECINYANTHNNDIKLQLYKNKIGTETLKLSKSGYYPTVSIFGLQGYNLGSSFNVSTGVGQLESRFNSIALSTSISIFNGFKNKNEIRNSNLTIEKNNADLENNSFYLSISICNQYLQVLLNKELLEFRLVQESISKKEFERLTKLYNSNLESKGKLLEIESAYFTDQKETIITKNALTNSLIKLQELLGKDLDETFNVEQINLSENFDEVSEEIQKAVFFDFENSRLNKPTKINLEMMKTKIRIAQANYYPRIDFNYSFNTNYYHIQGSEDIVFNQETNLNENNGFLKQLNNNKTHYFGLAVTIPVWNRYQTKFNVKKTKIEYEIAQQESENMKREFKSNFSILYNDMISSREAFESLNKAQIAQSESFKIILNSYKQGLVTSYEFLDSKSKNSAIVFQSIASKYEYIFKCKIIQNYILFLNPKK